MSQDLPAKIAFISKILDAAQISIADMSEVTGISRTTYYRWRDGKPASDRIRVNAGYITAQRMEQAIRDGRLPLTTRFANKGERLRVLKRIIRESTPTAG